jgi:hypothetical protein
MLSVIYAVTYAECHYAEYHYAECHGAQCYKSSLAKFTATSPYFPMIYIEVKPIATKLCQKRLITLTTGFEVKKTFFDVIYRPSDVFA